VSIQTGSGGSGDRIVIAGNAGGTNVGDSLRRAAETLGLAVDLVDARAAYAAPRLVARLNWWLRDRRPSRLREYSRQVVAACRQSAPRWLLTTGLAPVDRAALEEVRRLGVETLNYLTDDPWNPAFRSRWFLEAAKGYDRVFSTRRANLDDLHRLGCLGATYLPFGFDADLFYADEPTDEERKRLEADVFFAGGADADRAPLIGALATGGLSVALYGDYWDRFAETRRFARGYASPETVRKGIRSCAVSLCLVRRANRDGHSMRSFEVPAAGGVMLAEETDEHRALFGESGLAAIYFRTPADMMEAARHLVGDPRMRARLSAEAHRLVTGGGHTYVDRLRTMLDVHAA
jgi:spore maturation protein CgeB